MASHAGIPGDVRLVRRLVFREADVAIRTEDLARTVFLLQRIDQGHHRALDRLFVGLPMGVEVTLRVVQLEPDEKALVLLRPAAERGCHGVAIGYRAWCSAPEDRPKIAGSAPELKAPASNAASMSIDL